MRPAGSGRAGRRGRIGGTPVKYGDPIFLILKHMSQTAEIVAAYAITWFLLLSGVRIVVQRGVGAATPAS